MSSLPSVRAEAELPAIDERLVEPETRYEMLDGVVTYVSPADAPHGERQAQLLALLRAHVGMEFAVACELLTRTSAVDDLAPDASVYPAAPHPETGRRQLEQLAFEVVSEQSLGKSGRKAAKLVARGVRRVFAIDVKRSRALEWSAERAGWIEIDAPCIEDPVLDVALPIDALVHAVVANDAVARALILSRNPVIEAVRAQDREAGREAGRAEGKRETLLLILGARGVVVDSAARLRFLEEDDPERLDRWILRAATCTVVAELFIAP